MTPQQVAAAGQVLGEVMEERVRQMAKWGEQNLPDGTSEGFAIFARAARQEYEMADNAGALTYLHIMQEEVTEAFAESDPARLRAELIQVAAVAVAWIEAIDRRVE